MQEKESVYGLTDTIGPQLLQQGWASITPPADLLSLGAEALAAARSAFALPTERKREFVDPVHSGRTGWLAKVRAGRPNEIWQLNGSEDLPWPVELNASRESMENLRLRCIEVAAAALTETARAAGLPDDALRRYISTEHSFVRLLHYWPQSSFSPHADLGLATLFAGETTAALEMQNKSQQWVPVSSGWIVAAGKMLTTLSEGKVKAGIHRVGATSQQRWAVVVFVDPDPDCQVQLDEFQQPVTASAFFERARSE